MSSLPKIKFTQNWNHKLCLDVFPTFRLADREKYQLNRVYDCFLKDEFWGRVELVKILSYRLADITDAMSYLDVGHPATYLKSVFYRMYKNKNVNWNTQQLFWLLFKHLNHEQTRDNTIQQRSEQPAGQIDLFTASPNGLYHPNTTDK